MLKGMLRILVQSYRLLRKELKFWEEWRKISEILIAGNRKKKGG